MVLALMVLAGQVVSYEGALPVEVGDGLEIKGERRTREEHDAVYRGKESPWVVEMKVGEGRVCFVGIHHAKGADDPVYDELVKVMDRFEPGVILVEDRVSAFRAEKEKLREEGESRFLVGMGKERGVRVASWEPVAKEEGARLQKEFGGDRVLAFLTLRNVVGNPGKSDLGVTLTMGRRRVQYGLDSEMRKVDDLAKFVKGSYEGRDWRSIKGSDLWPREGHFWGEVAWRSNEIRDEHMIRLVDQEAKSGMRVMVVCGMSHLINMEPVFLATFEG